MDASGMPAWRRALYHAAELIACKRERTYEIAQAHSTALFLGATLKDREDTSLMYLTCKAYPFAHVTDVYKINLLQSLRPGGEGRTFHVFTLAYMMTQYISSLLKPIPGIVTCALVSCQPLVVFNGPVTRECRDWLHVWQPSVKLLYVTSQTQQSHKHSFKFTPLAQGEHVAHVAVLARHGYVVSVFELVAACNVFQDVVSYYVLQAGDKVLYKVSNSSCFIFIFYFLFSCMLSFYFTLFGRTHSLLLPIAVEPKTLHRATTRMTTRTNWCTACTISSSGTRTQTALHSSK
jgi:hypothetical protein